MKKRRVLFVDSSKSSCPEYQNVLNAANEHSRMAKAHCEDLWSDFWEYADEHFVDEFRVNFHQRWFEMYLTVSFIRAGLGVESQNSGPDISLALGERRVWIEAVCATEGQMGKPDSVPPLELGKVRGGPIDQYLDPYLKRIRNSLDEKAKKFKTYLGKRLVGQNDILVIAINGGQIPFLFADLSTCMMRSLYGVGNTVLTLNRSTREIVGSHHQHIEKIEKASGAEIGIQPFVDGSMDHVSAVLVSWAQAWSRPSTLGGDFVLYPNLSCRNRWARNLFPVAEEWLFEEDKDVGPAKRSAGRFRIDRDGAVTQLPISGILSLRKLLR